jgi:glycosyltransferase involved in cell wall biosynthesis
MSFSQVLLELERNSLNLEFHFIGDIPKSCRLQGSQYIYYGKLSNSSQIYHILQDCDILVCPSYSEGMPNVILEGMASGLAIIATDVGAVSAMVSKQNGWLIQPGNKQQLRQAIIEATQIPKEDLIVKKESSQLLVRENFTWNKVAQQTIASIKKIIYKE